MAEPVLKDSVAVGLGRLIEQFEDKPNIKGTLTSFLEETQKVEDLAFDVNGAFDKDTAIGVQLDVIGKLVGVKRKGNSDVIYRDELDNQIDANTADGTLNNLIDILTKVTSGNVQVFEHFPADIHIVVDTPEDVTTAALVEEITSAGVNRTMAFLPSGGEMLITQEIGELRRFVMTGQGDQVVTNDGLGGLSELVASNIVVASGNLTLGYLAEVIPSEGEMSNNICVETLKGRSPIAMENSITFDSNITTFDTTELTFDMTVSP